MLQSLDIDVAVGDLSPLSIELSIQIGVLFFAIVVNLSLFVNFGPQSLDEADVAIDPTLVVFVHSAFVFIQTAKVLFQVEKLVL